MNTNATNQLSTLRARHRQLHSELSTLEKRAHLTPSEQARARLIKKQKLRTKDRIRLLMHRTRIAE